MLPFETQDDLYYLLEVEPNADQTEIRNAYMRIKAAFNKESQALYTLISESEAADHLKKVEHAYNILSNPERRRIYDTKHGSLEMDSQSQSLPRESPPAHVVSIDRVPPMEDGEEGMLVPPVTDHLNGDSRSLFEKESSRHLIDSEIEKETEWKGEFLRKVREAKRLSIEEIADYTKISKAYLIAIEEENFKKLPATVFIRGFVTQVARFLKLPSDTIVPLYIQRVRNARSEI